MNYSNIFNNQEWITLKFSIIWMFYAIASADGTIDINEVEAINHIRKKADSIDNTLAKELLKSLDYNFPEISKNYNIDSKALRIGLREAAKIIDNKLTYSDAVEFKKTLLAIGAFIANSSINIIGFDICDEESQTLTELSLYMKLSKEDYHAYPTIFELMEDLIKKN